MKNSIILITFLLALNSAYAQDIKIESIKTKLDSLKEIYKDNLKLEDSLDNTFKRLKEEIDVGLEEAKMTELKTTATDLKAIREKLDNTLSTANVYLDFLKEQKIEDGFKEFLDYFKDKKPLNVEKATKEEPKEPKIMFYFGENKVLSEQDSIFNDKTFNDVFKDILNTESKTYLGDFVIPQDGQKVTIIKETKEIIKKRRFWFDKLKKEKEVELKECYFKSVKIHAKHGLIQDIKIKVTDEAGNVLLFENNVPISLLKYSRIAPDNKMFYRHTLTTNKSTVIDPTYAGYHLKLADVLMYINNPGENYVPDDLQLEYPTKKDDEFDNANSSVTYQIRQDSSLENVLNLRTYTDFLGLFGDTPNGIIQVEGKADFYIAPFNLPNSHNYLLKKISPYVNYARIEENDRNISVSNDSIITTPLDILQKSYLNMGLDLDVFSTKFSKEFPFYLTVYATARYNVADVKESDSTNVNYKSLALGGGVRFNVNRFNNFGLTLKSEVTKLDTNEFNDYSFVKNPNDFWVFRNEAEIFYHPAGDESQSIFLRLNTFNNASSGNNEAFFQLQFGYRFSVGLNKVKAK